MCNEGHVDDPSIRGEAKLLRRINPDWVVPDPKSPIGKRVTSQAFNDHPDGTPMSVQLADVLATHRIPFAKVLEGHEGYALAALTARLARAHRQGVMRKPLDDDPAHAEVFGPKSHSVRKGLAAGSEWVIAPSS